MACQVHYELFEVLIRQQSAKRGRQKHTELPTLKKGWEKILTGPLHLT